MIKRTCTDCRVEWYCGGDEDNCLNIKIGRTCCRCKDCWRKNHPTGDAKQHCFNGLYTIKREWRIA